MKMMKSILGLFMTAGLILFVGCNDDDGGGGGITTLDIIEISASGTDFETGDPVEDINLYGATAAEDVPLDATVEIVFDDDIEEEDASDHIIVEGGSTNPAVNTSVNGNTVTVTFADELERGTTYTMTIEGGIEGSLGGILNEDVTITFGTAGRADVDPPQAEGQVAYWSFDGNADDQVGDYDATEEVDITYVEDRFGQPESAASFNGTTSIIEVPDATPLVETSDFTLSVWVNVDSTDHQGGGHFVVGLGGANGFQMEISGNLMTTKLAAQYDLGETSGSEDLWIDASGDLGWQGWTFSRDFGEDRLAPVLQDTWAHIVFVYDSESKVGSAYVNGELAKRQDFNEWPDDSDRQNAEGLTMADVDGFTGTLAFGFITDRGSTLYDNEPWGNYESAEANHFQGELDDVRVFHTALSEEEVETLYNNENP